MNGVNAPHDTLVRCVALTPATPATPAIFSTMFVPFANLRGRHLACCLRCRSVEIRPMFSRLGYSLAALVALALTGCGYDWTGPRKEPGPLPLSSPDKPIVRLVDKM